MAKILVTGSTGFIGKRLALALLRDGHDVYALTRVKGFELEAPGNPRLHAVFGDLRDPHLELPSEIDVAYYLVHSMGQFSADLAGEEEQIAKNFVSLMQKSSCQQVIYLGGIIENPKGLSPHLASRLVVEDVLKNSGLAYTILRSSIIIGANSASFEIIRHLAEKLPIMITPKWVASLCQPISIVDVLYYLQNVLLHPGCLNQTFDIGGPEVLSFKDVLMRYAHFRGLRRYIIVTPILSVEITSYWLALVTPVKFSICKYLVTSMKQDSRKLNQAIDQVLPHTCLSYKESLQRTLQKIAQNEVISTWRDTWEKNHPADFTEIFKTPAAGCFKDIQEVPLEISAVEAQKRLWRIGGEHGWYHMDWAWRLRGFIDKMVGGVGLTKRRRDPENLRAGDALDFWKVIVADSEKGRLLLYAEMRLPGEAWLEFKVKERSLVQIATFRPRGVLGRLYWYVLWPIHFVIFRSMVKQIAARSQ